MKDSSFLIVGLARNCANSLRFNVSIFEKAFRDARNIAWFIVESDSEDRTVEVLYDLEKERSDFSYVSLGNLRYRYPKRTERIAFCRNKYLDFIANDSFCAKFDYIVVSDLDNVNLKVTASGIQSCWKRGDWDVCCANQEGPYYDIWALRHPLWSPNDCWEQAGQFQALGLSRFKSIFISVYARMISIPANSDWIEVDSAFGGLAIYRKSALRFVSYSGLGQDGEEICEHVALHGMIRSDGGRILINPALINAGVVEHARNATRVGLLRFWFRCQVGSLSYRLRLTSMLRRIKNAFSG